MTVRLHGTAVTGSDWRTCERRYRSEEENSDRCPIALPLDSHWGTRVRMRRSPRARRCPTVPRMAREFTHNSVGRNVSLPLTKLRTRQSETLPHRHIPLVPRTKSPIVVGLLKKLSSTDSTQLSSHAPLVLSLCAGRRYSGAAGVTPVAL